MPAIDMSVLCIPAECDNIKLPIEYEIASRWDANLLYDICRHFASVMLHFASLISHNLRCIPAYAHLIPTGFFLLNYHWDNLYSIFNSVIYCCLQRNMPKACPYVMMQCCAHFPLNKETAPTRGRLGGACRVGAVCVGVLWCGWVTFCNQQFLL